MAFEGNKTFDHLFREESGRMVSILVAKFGTEKLPWIEDAVQDAFLQLVKHFSKKDNLQNIQAWLFTTAKNKLIDRIRKEKKVIYGIEKKENRTILIEPVHVNSSEIMDSQLKLIYLCASLEVPQKDRIAITLKLVCGFGNKEIAKALQQKVETTKKRLQRARQKMQRQSTAFLMPLNYNDRLPEVLKSIYLIFSEGYYSPHNKRLVRKELCFEAMRLCKIIIDHPKIKTLQSHALMAMMCYHAARFDARYTDEMGNILLKDQNRDLWDRKLIDIGHRFLSESCKEQKISVFHLEALIAAQYILPTSYQDTNWSRLAHLYKLLSYLEPIPQVKLSYTVVSIYNQDIEFARQLYQELSPDDFQPNAYLYYAVGSELFQKSGNFLQAKKLLIQAISMAENIIERKLLERKLSLLEER